MKLKVSRMNSEFVIAVHALAYMGHKQDKVSSEELAENICTNPAKIRKVMSALRKQEIIATKEGKYGGYVLNKKPEDIYLDQLIKALNRDIIRAPWKSGSLDMPCIVASGMKFVMDGMAAEMNEQVTAYLHDQSIQDVIQQLEGIAQQVHKEE